MKINPIYIQLIGDAAIPLAGFFWWEWSLYFILLFYIMDLLVAEGVTHLKSKKVVEFRGEAPKQWMLSGAISFLLLVIVVSTVHGAAFFIHPGIDFQKELWSFWTYEELGVQQGYVLLPLLLFAGYQQYKLFFLAPRRHEQMRVKTVWSRQFFTYIVLIGACGLALSVAIIFKLQEEIVYVLAVVAGSTAFKWFYMERLPARSSNPRRK